MRVGSYLNLFQPVSSDTTLAVGCGEWRHQVGAPLSLHGHLRRGAPVTPRWGGCTYFPRSLPWSHPGPWVGVGAHQGPRLPLTLLAWVAGAAVGGVCWGRPFLVLVDPYLRLSTLQVAACAAPSQDGKAEGSPRAHRCVRPQSLVPGGLPALHLPESPCRCSVEEQGVYSAFQETLSLLFLVMPLWLIFPAVGLFSAGLLCKLVAL